MRLTAFFALTVLLAANPLEPNWVTDLRYCDLVVRGTVATVAVELKPRRQAMPMIPGGSDDAAVEVATIAMSVEEVIRGAAQSDTLRFVSLVGSFQRNYAPGQQLVVGLNWGKDVLGGSYWLWSGSRRLVRNSTGWVDEGSGTILKGLDELRSRLSEVAPKSVLTQCDIAVIGVVDSMRAKTIHGPDGSDAVQWSITLRDTKSLRGPKVPSEIAIRQITSGDYWPEWRDPAPLRMTIERGSHYCFLLRKIDDGYAPVRGINGMFEVRDGRLYFAGRTLVDLTIDDITHASK